MNAISQISESNLKAEVTYNHSTKSLTVKGIHTPINLDLAKLIDYVQNELTKLNPPVILKDVQKLTFDNLRFRGPGESTNIDFGLLFTQLSSLTIKNSAAENIFHFGRVSSLRNITLENNLTSPVISTRLNAAKDISKIASLLGANVRITVVSNYDLTAIEDGTVNAQPKEFKAEYQAVFLGDQWTCVLTQGDAVIHTSEQKAAMLSGDYNSIESAARRKAIKIGALSVTRITPSDPGPKDYYSPQAPAETTGAEIPAPSPAHSETAQLSAAERELIATPPHKLLASEKGKPVITPSADWTFRALKASYEQYGLETGGRDNPVYLVPGMRKPHSLVHYALLVTGKSIQDLKDKEALVIKELEAKLPQNSTHQDGTHMSISTNGSTAPETPAATPAEAQTKVSYRKNNLKIIFGGEDTLRFSALGDVLQFAYKNLQSKKELAENIGFDEFKNSILNLTVVNGERFNPMVERFSGGIPNATRIVIDGSKTFQDISEFKPSDKKRLQQVEIRIPATDKESSTNQQLILTIGLNGTIPVYTLSHRLTPGSKEKIIENFEFPTLRLKDAVDFALEKQGLYFRGLDGKAVIPQQKAPEVQAEVQPEAQPVAEAAPAPAADATPELPPAIPAFQAQQIPAAAVAPAVDASPAQEEEQPGQPSAEASAEVARLDAEKASRERRGRFVIGGVALTALGALFAYARLAPNSPSHKAPQAAAAPATPHAAATPAKLAAKATPVATPAKPTPAIAIATPSPATPVVVALTPAPATPKFVDKVTQTAATPAAPNVITITPAQTPAQKIAAEKPLSPHDKGVKVLILTFKLVLDNPKEFGVELSGAEQSKLSQLVGGRTSAQINAMTADDLNKPEVKQALDSDEVNNVRTNKGVGPDNSALVAKLVKELQTLAPAAPAANAR